MTDGTWHGININYEVKTNWLNSVVPDSTGTAFFGAATVTSIIDNLNGAVGRRLIPLTQARL